ncbi:MAG: TldD/PmbA family protein [Sulfolobales archaeon]
MACEEYALKLLDEALRRGADYVLVRFQERLYEHITADCGIIRNYGMSSKTGLGIQVVVEGGVGYAYTTSLRLEDLRRTAERAVNLAKATRSLKSWRYVTTSNSARDTYKVEVREDPFTVDPEEKVRLVREVNSSSIKKDGIVSVITRLACERDRRVLISSEGLNVVSDITAVGFAHMSVARSGDVVERVGDSKSYIGGYEHIRRFNWLEFAEGIDELSIKASQAKTPTPGTYVAVVDNDVVGLLLHEALGHASEGDSITTKESVLQGRLGEKVASELVSVVDEGLITGGYPVPYDDEGTRKTKTFVVSQGILTGYLSSRRVASELGLGLTGNGRAQDFTHNTLVRQTNYYMVAGDWRVEELFEGISYGIYLKGVGAVGGEVRPSVGTYTFSIGPSYIIRNGEVAELVRGVSVSGMVLETLKEVDAVANDLKVSTSVFGGCGKGGQSVRVGTGGPHIRVRKVVVGG